MRINQAISVIIPTFNEAGCIGGTITSVRGQNPREIIVVDGGSSDATCSLAREADLVLQSPAGRARQMNRGASRAGGDILLFLHADCVLEDGALAAAGNILAHPGVIAGCFRMKIPVGGWLYRCIEAAADARVRCAGVIYGDQGMFIRRKDFERLGGFPVLAFMEDLFFSFRLRGLGRVILAGKEIMVSPRRWQKAGLVRQTLRNWLLTAMALGGIHPDRLARFYPRNRS